MTIDREVFAFFLYAKRFFRGVSRGAVAKAAGVPQTCVQRAEERRPIGQRQFEKLCRWQSEDPSIFSRSELRSFSPPGSSTARP